MSEEHQNQKPASTPEERVRKQARMRRLTDPLGALGFRDTPSRYRREARARRAVFGGAAASLVVGTALIVAASNDSAESAPRNDASIATIQLSGSEIDQSGIGQSADPFQKAKVVFGNSASADQPADSPLLGIQSTDPAGTAVIPPPGASYSEYDDHDDERDLDDKSEHSDDHDDDDDRNDDHDDDGDHDDDDANPYVAPPQSQSPVSSDTQTVERSSITITQPQPHTQTNSSD